jgi:threonine/homoserine/homoserine lactone efflux protein
MAPLLEGVLLGLTLAIMLGPAFFTLLQTAIHRGFRSGAILAAGIFLSDLSLVLLARYGASRIIGDESNYLYFGIIGGIILVAFGVYTFTRKVVPAAEEGEPDIFLPSPFTYLVKGYVLNITNPFLWLFWLSVVVSVSSNYGVNTTQLWVFFSGLLGTVLVTDLLKSFAAGLIKGFLTHRILTIVNRVVGIFLMLFGLLLMIRVGYFW